MNAKPRGMNIDEIYFAACEHSDPEGRAAYLDDACGTDAEIRRRVEWLLHARAERGSFLEPPFPGPPCIPDESLSHEGPGTVIGHYKLLEQIGEGGMGVVYMAEQTEPVRRKVALKLIKPGMDTKQVVARFEAERQALALMDHLNIARVLDAGVTDSGRPYFVMELIRGVPITDYCDREKLSVRSRLELFMQICQAVQHAHQKGIIHRDIKPTNVLITLHDGVPVPKVIDFGVAKAMGQQLTEKTLFTGFAQLIGTPLYMSPEQAELSGLDVDTRSDIYSLGVLLYELLTGTTPFDQETFRTAALDEIRRIIREQEPLRPSTRLSTLGATLTTVSSNRGSDARKLTQSVRGELDWIAMKAIEKDRNRRYETASAFAADVRRYLDDEPVEACPPSASYRIGKFARRNRVGLSMAAVVAAALTAGTAVSTWQAFRAIRAERKSLADRIRAENSEKAARSQAERAQAVNDFLTKDLLIQAEPANNDVKDNVTLLEVLNRAADKVGDRFHDQPEAESAIRTTLVLTYEGLGAFDKAERQAQAALDLERRLHGPEAAGAFNALAHLAYMWGHLGRYRESIDSLELASASLQRILGPDHPDTLYGRNALANAYLKAGRTDEAIAMLEETLKLQETKLGADHPDAVTYRSNLAAAYLHAGRAAEAIRMIESVLKLEETRLGPDHPHTLISRNNLAGAYHEAGRTADAIAMSEKTVKLQETKLGPDHPVTLLGRNNLASAYLDSGRTAEAIAILEETLKLMGSQLGPNHPDTLNSRNNLASAHLAAGRTADAIKLHEATLKLMETKLGRDHPYTLSGRSNLAGAYSVAGRLAEAIRLDEDVLKLR